MCDNEMKFINHLKHRMFEKKQGCVMKWFLSLIMFKVELFCSVFSIDSSFKLGIQLALSNDAMLENISLFIASSVLISVVIHEVKTQFKEEACETLQSEIHITKEEFDELGRLTRTCSGDILVNKCEGACNSQVQPSVITPNGFLKECYCCRESFLKERAVILNHCYDPDGIRLIVEKLSEMEVKLREPANCKCYKCGNNPA